MSDTLSTDTELDPVEAPVLESFCTRLLTAAGLLEDHARTVSRNLVEAELRGISSHGVSRLRYYVDKIRSGGINTRPDMRVVREGHAYAVIDADNAPGAPAGVYAMDLCIGKARESGVGLVTVHGGNHFGYAAFYSRLALDHDMIGFTGCNTPAVVAVYGGSEPVLGTNPLSYAVPAGSAPPIIFDGATSTVARGKLVRALATGEPLGEGWALDSGGAPARTAEEALAGTLLAFGDYKGSAIAILVEVLSTLLSGAASSVDAGEIYADPTDPQRIGFFFGAIDISRFADLSEFKKRVDTLSETLRSSRRREGFCEIVLPGELEGRIEAEQTRRGISLAPDLRRELALLQQEFEIPDGADTASSAQTVDRRAGRGTFR